MTTTALRFAHGLSRADEAGVAAAEVIEQLEAGLAADRDVMSPASAAPPDLVLLFAGSDFTLRLGEILGPIRQRLRPATLVGVTVQGVVAGEHEHESTHAVSAFAATMPGVKVRGFAWDQMDWPELLDDNGTALRQRLFGEDAPHFADDGRAVVLFGDPFTCPTVRLLPAFEQALPGVPVVGGMASAGSRHGSNRLILDGEVTDTGAVGVAIAGPVDVRSTVSQGCRPIGKPVVITRSKRHIVQELAGRPALDVLREVALDLDSHDQRLALDTGLFVGRVVDEYKHRFGTGDFLIRGIAGVDPERGYLAVGDPQVRVGQTIQLHVRDAQAARDDLALLLDAERLHGPPAGALLLTCTGRGEAFFHDADVDASLVSNALDHPPLAGGFTHGELGPVGGRNHLHAHAVSLLTFHPPAATDA